MPNQPIRLLLADDDPIFSEIAEAMLRASGFSVAVTQNGFAAFDRLTQETFDAAIIDLAMPECDGFRLISLIRSTRHMKALPIAVVTVRDDQEAVDEACRLGANTFVSKPVNWRELPVVIRRLVETRGVDLVQDHASLV